VCPLEVDQLLPDPNPNPATPHCTVGGRGLGTSVRVVGGWLRRAANQQGAVVDGLPHLRQQSELPAHHRDGADGVRCVREQNPDSPQSFAKLIECCSEGVEDR
jgi:hypothetical protein